MTYRNYHVENVDNPILIDQCYMTPAATCAQFPSTLSIADVHFINITGTSSGAAKGVVVSMKCSTYVYFSTALILRTISFPLIMTSRLLRADIYHASHSECEDITATGTSLTPPSPFNASYICQNVATTNEVRTPSFRAVVYD